MRRILKLAVLLEILLGASLALAEPPAGNNYCKQGGVCRPSSVIVGGTLTFSDGTSQTTAATSIPTPVSIGNGGTGQTSANSALNALLPSQASNSGKFLTTNATNSSWSSLTTLNLTDFPSQTGNNAKYLTTNGTTLSWGTITAGLSGSGTSGQVAYFNGSSSLASDSNFKWDSSNIYLQIGSVPVARAMSESVAFVSPSGTNHPALTLGPPNGTGAPTTLSNPILMIGNQQVQFTAPSYASIGFGYTSGASLNPPTEFGFVLTDTSNSRKGDFYWALRNTNTNIAPSEKMRLTSAGDLLVGTSTDNGTDLLQVNGTTTATGYSCSGSTHCGTKTLTAGSGTVTVVSGCHAICTNSTSITAVQCSVTATTLTISGSGSDTINYFCF